MLATFDYVFVAESNRTALEFGDYVGFEQAMPHLSNSAYSSHRTAHGAARAPPPVQHFMAEFYAQNALDYELYLWGAAWNSTSTRRWREAGPTREIPSDTYAVDATLALSAQVGPGAPRPPGGLRAARLGGRARRVNRPSSHLLVHLRLRKADASL